LYNSVLPRLYRETLTQVKHGFRSKREIREAICIMLFKAIFDSQYLSRQDLVHEFEVQANFR